MDGRNPNDDRRRRPQPPPPPPWAEVAATVTVAVGGAATAALLLYGVSRGVSRLMGNSRDSVPEEQQQSRPRRMALPAAQGQRQQSWSWPSWTLPSWKPAFWKEVERRHDEEISAIKRVEDSPQGQKESGFAKTEATSPTGKVKYRHPNNEFEAMFQNLLKDIRINVSDKQQFQKAFEEVIDNILPEMVKVEPLFQFLFRRIAPAGSSWEDLRICSPNEFDVNLVLFPLDVQTGVFVRDLKFGHIGICVPGGFKAERNDVFKKLNQDDPKVEASYASISAKLKNWLDSEGYVKRESVMKWMQGVVDSALLNLKGKRWNLISTITRKISGPAVTLVIDEGKFSIDLVPAFEFSTSFLPVRVEEKINKRSCGNRTWYAIPKGPRIDNSPKLWRTSLYEYERDIMRGKELLKPVIRIIKRLRDCQNWKILASYYIKTLYMWQMEQQDCWNYGLGQMMMHAMELLEKRMRDQSVPYYWDDELNLLEGSVNPQFFVEVANFLTNINKKFERYRTGDKSADPMRYFRCPSDRNSSNTPDFLHLQPERNQECLIPQSGRISRKREIQSPPECVMM